MTEQNANINRVVPLYAARVDDLKEGEFVGVICDGCGHNGSVAVETIRERVAASAFVNTLGRKLRCEKCGERGHVIVDARRALGHV